MDINTSYNTNLQSLSGVQTTSLEKLSSALAINKAADDASGLQISDNLGIQKSSLTQEIENMNSGIAMSTIAQDGIASQKELLEDIKTETLKAMNATTSDEGKQSISDQISKYLDQYDQIANTTTYNNQSLLDADGSTSDDLSIVGDDNIIEMSKTDTKSISSSMRDLLSDFTTNGDSMNAMLEAVDTGLSQLAGFASDYGSASNAFEASAKMALSSKTDIATSQSTIMDIDYAKESSDFNKTNLQSQIGLIMLSQANAVQSRNVTLLS
ncbi:MAG: flagellin [Campylobacterota bacterium]|nr:flagellin [Campylobacterota bacterium]